MERFFCVGIAPLVALMAADRETSEESREPLRQHPPPPHPTPARGSVERGMEVLSAAHS